LDSSGIFLYHPENSFIGENAFEIRSARDPHISFAQINEIQRNEMMKGKEGSGEYLSGWHRDVIEPMEKLIAYAPVRIQGPYLDYVWSVAVVAPVEEVEGTITAIYGRQIFLEGWPSCSSSSLPLWSCFTNGVGRMSLKRKWRPRSMIFTGMQGSWIHRERGFGPLLRMPRIWSSTLDGEGIVKTMNLYMSRLFGVSTDELAGQSLYCLLPFDQTEDQLKLVNQVLRSRDRLNAETIFRIHEQDFWFNLQYIPVRDEGSGEDYVLAIGRDVTERKSLEKQLINTEKTGIAWDPGGRSSARNQQSPRDHDGLLRSHA